MPTSANPADYRTPAVGDVCAKAITGVSGLRPGDDLQRCWPTQVTA
jgi:hypothetical protein